MPMMHHGGWKDQTSAAAETTLIVAAEALATIGHRRMRVRDPVLLAYKDASDLQHIRELRDFSPTHRWQSQWLSDLNKNAAALSSMETTLRSTDDPLADVVHSVAVTVARSLALIAAAPLVD